MCLQAVHPGQARLSAGKPLSRLFSTRWNGKNAANTKRRRVSSRKIKIIGRRRKVGRLYRDRPSFHATGEKLPSDKDNRAFYFAFRGTIFRAARPS